MTTPIIAVQYCPFCGEKLEILGKIHFCPYCGKKIRGKDHKQKLKKSKPAKKEMLVRDNGFSSERVLLNPVSGFPVAPDADYTVVLKYCPNKDELFIKLTGLLQRERFAIRLAVDMTPAVLMYRSHWEDALPVMKACQAAGALFSIVCGEVSFKGSFPQLLLSGLSETEQQLIRESPSALWLGETFYCAVGQVESNGKRGVLVLSSHYLYFIFGDTQHLSYEMTPLDQMTRIECAKRREFTVLVIHRAGQESEDFYATAQQVKIMTLQQVLQTAVKTQSEQYL